MFLYTVHPLHTHLHCLNAFCLFSLTTIFNRSFQSGPALAAALLLFSTHLACATTFNGAVLWLAAQVMVLGARKQQQQHLLVRPPLK
jgi:hypothetical protein